MPNDNREMWIWLPHEKYPEYQTTILSGMNDKTDAARCVVRASREYHFDKPVASVSIRFSGDSAVILFCNDQILARGPACVGGDFLSNDRPRPQYYATELTLAGIPGMEHGCLDFSALVRMMPVQMCDYSMGHGGFFLNGRVEFCDGTCTVIGTDERWTVQPMSQWTIPGGCDTSRGELDAVGAERIPNIWHCRTSPIPPCTLDMLYPEELTITVNPGETITRKVVFDRIYAGYITASSEGDSILSATVRCGEISEYDLSESFTFTKSFQYYGFTLYSIGVMAMTVTNTGSRPARIRVGLQRSYFPIAGRAQTVTADEALNQVLDTCAHTLKYCRQSHHLDSPRHCEPMACTGDYYIEMLMTAFTFGDQRLSAFDIRRTAELLRYNDGRMFHTTYSLIWVLMLRDCYMLTGEHELLADCEDALILLLERFTRYLGTNGLIETPPDFMFVDWLNPDGISTHHPPKALGQTCLNLFYYGALRTAAEIFAALERPAMAQCQLDAADALREAIIKNLWDAGRGLFFEGLNTPTPPEMVYQFLPQNVKKRYYRKHANILAAYFGIFPKDEAAALLRRIIGDDSLGEVQPYFQHFLLEAVLRNGLREEYTLPLLEQWKQSVAECPKGLAEGFIPPGPGYGFDHSHAWGGTPAYALPMALTGLELLSPGFERIRLAPSLLGLEQAFVEIPTPKGMITVLQKRGEKPEITLPRGIVRVV